jgi:1,2-diacylglycerol-3-alpha-glucose alpha-1,2-galactosyltransferase
LYFALAPLYPGRRVLSAHVVPESHHQSTAGWRLLDPVMTRFLVRSFNTADLLISVAPSVRRNLEARGVTAPQAVVPNPVDLSRFRPDEGLRLRGRALLGLAPGERVVLGVGLPVLRKGFDQFLEVAAMNPALRFVWVGGNSFSVLTDGWSTLHRRMRAAPRNVRFPGMIPLATMPEVYNAADVLLFPSRQETFGLVALEAAACGLPLVLRDLPHFHEVFDEAFLSGTGPDSFSARIRDLLRDPAGTARMRGLSLALADRYSSRAVAERLVSEYQALYAKARGRRRS